MGRNGDLPEIERRKARCRELGKKLGDLATALMDEERVLEATAERKRLLATLADLRAPLGASLGHLHGYLITGDERLHEAFQKSYDKAMEAFRTVEAQRRLLTATQSTVFASLSEAVAELAALVPDLLAAAATDRKPATGAGSAALEESAGIAGRITAALTAMLDEERELPATPQRKELLAQIANVRGPLGIASSHLRDYTADGNPSSRRLFHEFLQRAAGAFRLLDEASAILSPTQATAFRTVKDGWGAYGRSAESAMRAFDEAGVPASRQGTATILAILAALTAPPLLTLAIAAEAGLPHWIPILAGLELVLLCGAAAWMRNRLLRPLVAAALALEAAMRGEALPTLPDSSPMTARLLRAAERASLALADSSGALTAAVADHRRQMVERRQAMLRLSDDFAREIHQSIKALEDDVATLFEQVRTIRGLASTVGDEAGSVDLASTAATGNLGAIVAAIHQMSATAGDITQQVQRSATISADASGTSQRAREAVAALADTAEQIRTIVAMIEKVATETQVLALNATIEAARAGEAGRGFAVVAGEVKSLAHKTTGMTQEIRTLVDAVRADTTRTADAVTAIAALIDNLGSTAGVIETATSQQGEATHEIARAATGTSDEMSGIGSAIHSLRTGVGNAQTAAGRLEELAGGLARRATDLHAEAGRFIAGVRAA